MMAVVDATAALLLFAGGLVEAPGRAMRLCG